MGLAQLLAILKTQNLDLCTGLAQLNHGPTSVRGRDASPLNPKNRINFPVYLS